MASIQVVRTSVTTNNKTGFLRTTPTGTINQLQNIDCENGFHTGCPNVCHNQQQNRLSQDYTNRDNQPATNIYIGLNVIS